MGAIRWSKHLKSNSFDMGKINLKSTAKIEMMMAIVVFLYTLSIIEGLLKIRLTRKLKSDFKKIKGKIYQMYLHF